MMSCTVEASVVKSFLSASHATKNKGKDREFTGSHRRRSALTRDRDRGPANYPKLSTSKCSLFSLESIKASYTISQDYTSGVGIQKSILLSKLGRKENSSCNSHYQNALLLQTRDRSSIPSPNTAETQVTRKQAVRMSNEEVSASGGPQFSQASAMMVEMPSGAGEPNLYALATFQANLEILQENQQIIQRIDAKQNNDEELVPAEDRIQMLDCNTIWYNSKNLYW
jgi:hypothetical protein